MRRDDWGRESPNCNDETLTLKSVFKPAVARDCSIATGCPPIVTITWSSSALIRLNSAALKLTPRTITENNSPSSPGVSVAFT